MSEGHLVDPTPELPDDTPIEDVRFSTRIRNVLAAAGLTTVGEVRETAERNIAELPRFWVGLGHPPSRDVGPAVGSGPASHRAGCSWR